MVIGLPAKGVLLPLMLLAGMLSGCGQISQLAAQSSQKPTVTLIGEMTGEQQERLEKALIPFEKQQGIEVIYEGSSDLPALYEKRLEQNQPADLIIFSQPGVMASFAREGKLVPLEQFVDGAVLRTAYPDSWIDLGSVDEVLYALWFRISIKSLVWYRPTAFEAKGYDIPTSWEELTKLSDQIVADGGTPWCIGLESGAASGWPATDWIEDIMLRTAGPEAYSQWIDHRLLFNSPPVIRAINEFGKFLRTPKYVSGGPAKAIVTPYGESVLGVPT